MADALDNVITEITTLMAAMTGINQAPEYPPEGLNDPPMVITYHVRAPFTYSAGITFGLHTIHCDVLLSRSNLPADEAQARPYIIRGLNALAANVTLSDTCSHCLLREVIGPGIFPYAGANYYGVRYVLEVKINHDVEIAA